MISLLIQFVFFDYIFFGIYFNFPIFEKKNKLIIYIYHICLVKKKFSKKTRKKRGGRLQELGKKINELQKRIEVLEGDNEGYGSDIAANASDIEVIKEGVSQNLTLINYMWSFINYKLTKEPGRGEKTSLDKWRNHLNAQIARKENTREMRNAGFGGRRRKTRKKKRRRKQRGGRTLCANDRDCLTATLEDLSRVNRATRITGKCLDGKCELGQVISSVTIDNLAPPPLIRQTGQAHAPSLTGGRRK